MTRPSAISRDRFPKTRSAGYYSWHAAESIGDAHRRHPIRARRRRRAAAPQLGIDQGSHELCQTVAPDIPCGHCLRGASLVVGGKQPSSPKGAAAGCHPRFKLIFLRCRTSPSDARCALISNCDMVCTPQIFQSLVYAAVLAACSISTAVGCTQPEGDGGKAATMPIDKVSLSPQDIMGAWV